MDGQKFIGRNRAPRVQIEYEVEHYGQDKKIELPFVMAVTASLSGSSVPSATPVAERRFLELDSDNFAQCLAQVQPQLVFEVPDTLAGRGTLPLCLRFAALTDFQPDAVARQIPAVQRLWDARQRLANLLTYMDGKTEAEDWVAEVLRQSPPAAPVAALPPTEGPGHVTH